MQLLILILILIVRFGYAMSYDMDANLLICGTTVGFSIIVSAIILNYLLGGSASILEVIWTLFSTDLFLDFR